MGGILPFGAIFIELFFIMTSVWLQRFYYVFGFLMLVPARACPPSCATAQHSPRRILFCAGAAHFTVDLRRDLDCALLFPVVQRGLQLVVALVPHFGVIGPLFVRLLDHVFFFAA